MTKDGYALTGVLQCYCDNQSNFISGYTYDTKEYYDSWTNTSAAVCETYTYDLLIANLLSNAVSYSIVAINFILRLIIIKCIMYIGLSTESEQTKLITDGVFIT